MATSLRTATYFCLLLALCATNESAVPDRSLTLRQANACTPACTPGQTYCSASSSECEQIPYAPVAKTSKKPASKGKAAFHVVVFSDVQYDYVRCKNNPLSECIYTGLTGRRPARIAALAAAAERQARCIYNVSHSGSGSLGSSVKLVIHNGDIVNGGLPEEVAKVEALHNGVFQMPGMPPLAVALGNHDYFLGDTAASVRTLSYYETTLRDLAARMRLRAVDYDTSPVVFNAATQRDEKYSRGSLAVSLELNRYVFILLHWSTALRSGVYTNRFDAFDDRAAAFHSFNVTPVTDWLIAQLDDAKRRKRKVVLIPHSFLGLRLFTNRVPNMTNVLRDSSIIAVVSGHTHDAYGFDSDWTVGNDGQGTRNIPVYYAGSATYQKFITLNMKKKKKGMEVDVYDSKVEPCAKTNRTSTRLD